MKNILFRLMAFSSALILLCACQDDDSYEDIPVNEKFDFKIPDRFPEIKQDINSNYPTKWGVALGRKLFYDSRLSKDNTISCSFCHEQQHAFTHHGHDLSHGINNLEGIRNAPSVQNLIFQTDYFYDGASNSMQMLSVVPIHNPVEMDETLPAIVAKLKQDPEYVKMFRAAFENGEVSSSNLLNALAQFMTIMISADSKYDKYVRNESGGNFSSQELKGLELFKMNCASCHATDIFTDNSFRNNGLPPNLNLNDLGRETVTGFIEDRYKFKVPSLRNVELTAPYMHDGRFGSLQSVLNFYSDGVQNTQNLDPLLQQHSKAGIPLTNEEKEALIAFLKTLTDYEYIKNPLFYYKT
ncbi:cytochrome c peroxidase [Paenimyroides aquimaris]|uniref:Cytochrome c peroxidase n=1 Tax=Paenimyroides marinum TaxID=1159016 RepID=A0A1H6J4A3_9FLAO|nr:cytochrome c peroxidase [Paenimyroides aquimaris]SEH55062.1 cytochrome c peroxidase [Paenimyroides aquimaris]